MIMTNTIDKFLFFCTKRGFSIVADDVVKLILPLKAEGFRCYNDYFDWMIFWNIIHENELLLINLPTGDVERNET
jgi:hypothetical protein